MDRRRERRLNLEFPVRIWGMDRMARPFAEIVRVGNVSNSGAVLIGVRSKVETGDLLDVQLGASRAQFRIVWMGPSGEAGMQALAFERPIFDMGFGVGSSQSFRDGGNRIGQSRHGTIGQLTWIHVAGSHFCFFGIEIWQILRWIRDGRGR